VVPFSIAWILSTLAGLCLLATSIHRESIRQFKHVFGLYRKQVTARLFAHSDAHSDSVAHDNHFH
jgi:mxaL protein